MRLCGGHSTAVRRFFAAAILPGGSAGQLFLAFSIPAGLGTAFLYPSIQSCAQKWYAGRKGLATGVIGGAVGLSGAFLTGFVRTAVSGFGIVQGIRGAFWALGAHNAARLPCGQCCCCRTRRKANKTSRKRQK